MQRRSSQVLAQVILFSSIVVMVVGFIVLGVLAYKDRKPAGRGSVGNYEFDFIEHQHYWEAENR